MSDHLFLCDTNEAVGDFTENSPPMDLDSEDDDDVSACRRQFPANPQVIMLS